MIEYIKKDLTTVELGMIAHGCNCSGGFGSGVAGAIRKKWPQVHEAFEAKGMGKELLGNVSYVEVKYRLQVANCYTQVFYGKGGGKYADASAILNCLSDVFNQADWYTLPIYMPKIGCGLGGLDWDKDVKPTVETLSGLYPRVEVYVCDL